ncbi:hypothetical protein H2198_004162 [Neophaeococcomyces mojaviensis]|uniref:Uncharacterized protein n=1 Tax=Neophaeococcomyces mojaviensis TaxID=3383035 RepID=A0ACC3A9A3_9EURO|nr:hypothetical protein H2198_004162 [Knufia sp. JES_112]
MASFLASCACAILDPLITLPASLTTQLIDHYTRSTKQASEHDTTLNECRYQLDTSTSSTLILPDSRTLGYAQYGSSAPGAHTIFYVHGWPASRVEGTFLDSKAKRHNVRIICMDRPGIGLSSPHPTRTILSHARDIDHLAQHLQAERYGVLGVSGGGPYALACAYALPANKLKVVSLVCGLGPPDIGYWGMHPLNYLGWTYSPHYFPRFTKWWFSREPGARLDLNDKERMNMLIRDFQKSQAKMHPKDVKIFGDIDFWKVHLRRSNDVYAQGTDWFMQDMKLLASDPGFRIQDIRKDLKVQLWYGKLDKNVPLKHGEEVARRLGPGAELRVKEDDTHASIFFDWRDDFLGEMVKAM